jgi:hypothetical protein
LRFLLLLAVPSIRLLRRDVAIPHLRLVVATVSTVDVLTFSTPRFTVVAEPAVAVLVGLSADPLIRAHECERGDSNPHSLSATGS